MYSARDALDLDVFQDLVAVRHPAAPLRLRHHGRDMSG